MISGVVALCALSAATFAFAQTQDPLEFVPPLTEEEKPRIINLSSNMANRTESVIARFENIVARLESRAAKLEATGINADDEQFYLGEARKYIDIAKEQMRDIDNRILNFVNAPDFVMKWFDVRDSFLESKSVLISAQELISNSARDLGFKEQGIYFNTPVETLNEN